MNKKVCLKGDGTIETGRKIIEYLESLGGKNHGFIGTNAFVIYYFIDGYDSINNDTKIPEGYTLIELPKPNQYPKLMLVSHDNKSWRKRVVFMEKCKMFLAWDYAESLEDSEKIIRTSCWNYAKDIKEEAIVELTLKDISEGKGVGVPPHLIRIKE